MTWPVDRRISIIAVEALSRALSSSLAVIEYSSINSAVSIITEFWVITVISQPHVVENCASELYGTAHVI